MREKARCLALAGALVAVVGVGVGRAADAAQCAQTFAVESAVSMGDDEAVNREYALHQACLAVQRGSPAACVFPHRDAEWDAKMLKTCEDLYWGGAVRSKLLVTAAADPAGARRLCIDMLGGYKDLNFPKGIDSNKYCDLYVRYAGDPRERMMKTGHLFTSDVSQFEAMAKDPVGVKKLEAMLQTATNRERRFQGQWTAAECLSRWLQWPEQQSCLAASGYRAASAAGSPDLCGKSAICRAMMGDKAACAVHKQKLSRLYCAGRAKAGK